MKLGSVLTNLLAFVIIVTIVALTALGCSDDSKINIQDGDSDSSSTDSDKTDGDTDIEQEQDSEQERAIPFDYCNGENPPDKECWTSKRAPDSENIRLARSIADWQIIRRNPEELRWDWTEAVLMISLIQLYRVTGVENYLDFPKRWIDHHIEEGYVIGTSDTCAPTAVALALLEENGEEKYRTVMDDALHYLYEVALRTEEGGLNHLGDIAILGTQLWIDSLFMFGNVLTGWGEYANDDKALDEYAEQFAIFTDLLQEQPGFYKHAYNSGFEQEDNVYWGRGNGWVSAAAFDHLRVRCNRNESLPEMEQAAKKLADAIVAHQDIDTGLWWTVLNRPGETYLETSCGALFAFGLARGYRYGYLDNEVLPTIHMAIEGLRSRIIEDEEGHPLLTGTSGPTNVGTFESYANIGQQDDISFGLGAAILALIETSGLPDTE